MTQEIEIEFKILLTKKEYDRLLKHMPFPKTATEQINYYFETKQFHLKEKGCAFRIREKNGSYVATVKEPHPEGLLETHDILTEKEAQSWLQGNLDHTKATITRLSNKGIKMEQIVYFGKLLTKRRQFKDKNIHY